MKVMTIVGTRPEIIKLSSTLKELDKYTEHILVHTGQNYDYELNEVFFKDLGLREPDVYMNAAGENAAETIGNVIIKSDELIKKYKPDAILLYGDTNSCLSVISAKRNKVPVFHMEAGNRCFDERVPDSIIPGSRPAKASIEEGLENLEISPNSEMIPAQEIAPIPLIERVGGLSSLIIDSILFSSLLISTSI